MKRDVVNTCIICARIVFFFSLFVLSYKYISMLGVGTLETTRVCPCSVSTECTSKCL